MRATSMIDGRVVVRVSELAEMMGCCKHTIFVYIQKGTVDSVLVNARDRRIYLDSVVGASNVHRPFVDAAQAAKLIHQSTTRIYLYARQGKIDYVKGPGKTILVFLDTLTKPDFEGKELLTQRAARERTGLTTKDLLYLLRTGGVQYVTIPSGFRRVVADSLPKDEVTATDSSSASLSA